MPVANAMAIVATVVTTVNAAASTTTSMVRAAKNARRFGCTVNTFLLKPLSNSAVRKMAMKMTKITASPPPLRNIVPTSASAVIPLVIIEPASAMSSKSLASGLPSTAIPTWKLPGPFALADCNVAANSGPAI